MVKIIGYAGIDVILPKIVDEVEHSNESKNYYESFPKKLKLNDFLKIIVNHFFDKINKIISEENINNNLYDEILIFQLNKEHIDLLNYPIFILKSRTDDEGFDYINDATRILKLFKLGYYGNHNENVFNKPILLENASGTEFDILIVIDAGYIIFLNKKNGIVSNYELEKYKYIITDMIYCIRTKILSLI